MKPIQTKTDRVLAGVFALSMAAYMMILVTAFAELPINIPSWHQFLLISFHIIPMFCLQLLLCRLEKLRWRLLIPAVLLMSPGIVFLWGAEWAVMAWILFLCWCVAPALGGVLAWIVWLCALSVKPEKADRPEDKEKPTEREHDYKI